MAVVEATLAMPRANSIGIAFDDGDECAILNMEYSGGLSIRVFPQVD